MTPNAFASLSVGTYSRLVRARQAWVVALNALSDVEDLCTCSGRGRCACDAANLIEVAEVAYRDAQTRRAEEEASWVSYSAIRKDDIATKGGRLPF